MVFVLTHGLEIVDRIRKREIFKIVSATVTVGAPISRAASENLFLSAFDSFAGKIEMAIHVGFRREAGSYEAVTLANSNACATYEGKIVKDIALCRRKQIPAALRQRLWSFRINS